MERHGLIAGGNFIVDNVKIIKSWPQPESLTDIESHYLSNGGGAYNVLKDLAYLNVDFPLEAIGLVGHDLYGNFIIEDCQKLGIETRQLIQTPVSSTSYTDVMTTKEDGVRTFFHHRGANALLDIKHFNLSISNAKIFHLAYLMLLDKLDAVKYNKSNDAAKLFRLAKDMGFVTSADLVTIADHHLTHQVLPSLPFIDYLFLNEKEATNITGLETTKKGKIHLPSCVNACGKLIDWGIRKYVILHHAQGAIAMNAKHDTVFCGAVDLPPSSIAGAVGAGDAFAAGVLAAIHNDKPIKESLHMGVCVAAKSLEHATSSNGLSGLDKCMELGQQYGYKEVANL